VSAVEYSDWLDRAAVATQLRRTSNGECSAAVADCMAAGAALIVTDIGASRELPPECAHRVDPAASAETVAATIAELLGDTERRARMIDAARQYATANSFRAAAARLFDEVIAPELARPVVGREPQLVGRVPRVQR
jgi:glycosyltransferase involved in cell wall biosynthesis